jgi:hypothetical protein
MEMPKRPEIDTPSRMSAKARLVEPRSIVMVDSRGAIPPPPARPPDFGLDADRNAIVFTN